MEWYLFKNSWGHVVIDFIVDGFSMASLRSSIWSIFFRLAAKACRTVINYLALGIAEEVVVL